MNPYLAGFLLGLVLLFSYYFTREGLGSSGAMKQVVVAVATTVAPEASADHAFLGSYAKQEQSPLKSRLVFMALGVLAGGFISGVLSHRLKFKVEHSKGITPKKRLVAATIGGMLFGIGSQLGRGCTSGAALSGMSSLSAAGFLAMIAIFGSGYAFAYLFRKLWI